MAKRQAVEREETRRGTDRAMARSQAKGSTEQSAQKSTAGLHHLSDRVKLREVWVQQASLLIQQVERVGQFMTKREHPFLSEGVDSSVIPPMSALPYVAIKNYLS